MGPGAESELRRTRGPALSEQRPSSISMPTGETDSDYVEWAVEEDRVGDGEEGTSCRDLLTPVNIFALCGLMGSMVHALILSILSISMITISNEFKMTWSQRGFILSAFSLTYAIFQVPGGFFVMRCGPYVGPFVACVGGFISLSAIPLCVDASVSEQKGGGDDNSHVVAVFYGFMLVLGFLGVGFNPAFHDIIAHKVELQRRSFVHNTVYSGQQLGYVLATVGVNVSIDHFGWRITFFLAGGVCLCVGVIWRLFVDRNMPNVDTNAQDAGDALPLSFVVDAQAILGSEPSQYEKWRAVITSPAFMVICLNHFGAVWTSRAASNRVLLTCARNYCLQRPLLLCLFPKL